MNPTSLAFLVRQKKPHFPVKIQLFKKSAPYEIQLSCFCTNSRKKSLDVQVSITAVGVLYFCSFWGFLCFHLVLNASVQLIQRIGVCCLSFVLKSRSAWLPMNVFHLGPKKSLFSKQSIDKLHLKIFNVLFGGIKEAVRSLEAKSSRDTLFNS